MIKRLPIFMLPLLVVALACNLSSTTSSNDDPIVLINEPAAAAEPTTVSDASAARGDDLQDTTIDTSTDAGDSQPANGQPSDSNPSVGSGGAGGPDDGAGPDWLNCVPTVAGLVPYQVQAGDTLFSIATRFGMTTADLAWRNCIEDPDRIIVGQTLYVMPTYTPTYNPPAPGNGGAPNGWTSYSVREGDTLALLARPTFTTVDTLIAHNNLSSPNNLAVGQQIYLPFDPIQGNNLMAPIPSRLTYELRSMGLCLAFEYPDPWRITGGSEVYNYTMEAGRGGLERYQFKFSFRALTNDEYITALTEQRNDPAVVGFNEHASYNVLTSTTGR